MKIAVTLANVVGPAGNQSFGLPTTSEQQAKYAAVLDAVNTSGGVACRKVVAQYFAVNPADQNDMHQKCLDIVAANVFSVIDDGGEALAPDCFGQNRIPYIGENLLFAASASKFYPYLFTPFALYDTAYRNMVFGLKSRGFFNASNGFKKLGFIYFNCVPNLITEIEGWFREAGLSDAEVVTYGAGCPSPPLANPSDLEQAVLKFKSNGVTHVTSADIMGSFANFTVVANQQGFKPKYGIADDGYIGISYGSGKPDASNFDGAVAITPTRFGEERTAGSTPTAGTTRCNDIYRTHGLPPVYQQSVGSNGGFICDMLWMLKAAGERAPVLSRESLAGGLQATKSIDFSYPAGPNDLSGNNVTYGGQFWRADQWLASCTCWRLLDPSFHPST